MKDMRAWAVRVLAGLILLTPAVLVFALHPDDTPTELKLATDPLTAFAARSDRSVSGLAHLALRWVQYPAIVAGPWAGIVTRNPISSLDAVSEGDVVIQIDGVDRVAVATTVPFFRSLTFGDSGPDVVQLRLAMGRLGWMDDIASDPNSPYDAAMFAATRSFALSIGVSGYVSGFDPAWVAWLPAGNSAFVWASDTPVGGPAPTAGMPIGLTPPALASAVVTPDVSNGPPPAGFLGDGLWVVAPAGEDLRIHLTDRSVASADLAVLSAQLNPTDSEWTGNVRAATTTPSVAMPSSAFLYKDGGQGCVYVRDSAEGTWTPVSVASFEQDAGAILIADQTLWPLLEGKEVLLEPQLSDVKPCP